MSSYKEVSNDDLWAQDQDPKTCVLCADELKTRQEPGILSWARSNWFKIIQLLFLVYISALLTVNVAYKLQSRTLKNEGYAGFLDWPMKFKAQEEWGEYEQRNNHFNIPPSDELDHTWRKLLEARNILLTPEEVQSLGANTTDRLRTTTGHYVAVLGPYHQLHCVNIIRRLIHWDYYGPRMTKEQQEAFIWKQHHSDHCLEVLRQSIMCNAYPSFYLGEWVADSYEMISKELRTGGKSQCVDWDSLDDWAHSRALDRDHVKLRPGPYERKHGKDERPKSDIIRDIY